MSDSLPEQGKPWPLYIAIGVAVLLIGLALFFAGSGEPPHPDGDPAAANGAADTDDTACDRKLSEILTAVDPLTLGISSSPADRMHDLNLWRTECGRPPDGKPITEDREQITRLLEADAVERVARETFTQRDVAHLRTAMLLRQLAEHVAPRSESVTAQVIALFEFIDRNILDPMPGAPEAPLSLYEILCYGRGNAEQRAWLFAELLRQIRLDAVLIQPTADNGESPYGPLIGVIVTAEDRTDVLMFDLRIGLPIPGPDEADAKTPFVTQPATLAQLQEDDALLRNLDVEGRPYPLTSAQLQSVKVGLIGSSSLWSERMALLDFNTSHRDAVLYDGLGSNRMQAESLLDRARAAGNAHGWADADVFVWSYPESQLAGFESLDLQQQPLIVLLNGILQGPYLDTVSGGDGNQLDWRHNLRDSRNLQITGDFKAANVKYKNIRGAQIIGAYQYRPENDAVQDFAAFWTAMCQYEMGEDESVRNSIASYPPRFFSNWAPFWTDGVIRLAAYSSARLGRWADAIVAIQQPNLPQTHGTAYLMRRWQRLAAGPMSPAPATETPASMPPEGTAPMPDAAAPPATDAAAPATPMPAAEPSAATPATPPASEEMKEEKKSDDAAPASDEPSADSKSGEVKPDEAKPAEGAAAESSTADDSAEAP